MEINVNRINKYHVFLKQVSKKKVLHPSEVNNLIKDHKCSTSVLKVLVDGGLLLKSNNMYKWTSPVLTRQTAIKTIENLKKYNQDYYKRKKAKENTKAHKELSEWALINSMPKAKVKKPKEVDVNESSDSVTNVTWFWGLYTKTKWY
tara:strand:+ start:7896 stop:8336 length:441 start_codon:yes stop_codon:yes gene_type:complete